MKPVFGMLISGLAGLVPILATTVLSAQVPVRVGSVDREPMQQRQAVTGSLRAVARGNVAALEPGQLVELTVREGDAVKKGDIIARIDARRLEAQRAEAAAEKMVAAADLQSSEATAVKAKADHARAEKLYERNAVSRQELDAAQAEALVTTANIDAAKRRIDRIEQTIRLLDVRLKDTRIRAPYDATVVTRHLELGDWVQAGDPLLTLVSTGPIEAWLEVPERYAGEIDGLNNSVAVRSRASRGSLRVLSTKRVADVNPRVRTMHLIVKLENPAGLLAPGMSVEGWIPAGEKREYTSVPKDAVIRSDSLAYVFVIQDSNNTATAKQVPVRVLFETTARVAVESPALATGAQVVVEGNERLTPGQTVTVIKESPKAEKPTIARR
jgi:RND family efflux transporter MFP subunit